MKKTDTNDKYKKMAWKAECIPYVIVNVDENTLDKVLSGEQEISEETLEKASKQDVQFIYIAPPKCFNTYGKIYVLKKTKESELIGLGCIR
jgi:hypothetical protein